MKLFFILFCSLTLFVNADTITDMQTEQRVALIIGNNNYSGILRPLINPKNDAQAIKEVLKSRGFEVIYKTNITKREFKESISRFNAKIEQGGVGLFYYSGHGIEVENKNYLIPIDARLKKKMDTEFESIELNYIIRGMQESKNRLNIIILDACRTNPFFDGKGSEGGLAEVKPIGLFVSYATGAGKIARDNRDGKNGLFTKYLVYYMKQPLTLQEVFHKTREKVYQESSKEQFPAIYDQIVNGRFYFTLPNISTILSSKEDTSNYSTLNIETTPKNAIIELVGLGQEYYKGIKLRNGRYKIKVSKYGYIAKGLEVDLNSNTKLSVILNEEKIVYAKTQKTNNNSLWNQAKSSKNTVDKQVHYIIENLKKEIFNMDCRISKPIVAPDSKGTYNVSIYITWKINGKNVKNIFSKYNVYGKILSLKSNNSNYLLFSSWTNNNYIFELSLLKNINKKHFYLNINLNSRHKRYIAISQAHEEELLPSLIQTKYRIMLRNRFKLIFYNVTEEELKNIPENILGNIIFSEKEKITQIGKASIPNPMYIYSDVWSGGSFN